VDRKETRAATYHFTGTLELVRELVLEPICKGFVIILYTFMYSYWYILKLKCLLMYNLYLSSFNMVYFYISFI
jgi:hypothetical protein